MDKTDNKTDSIISAIIAGFIGVVLLTSLIPEMTEIIAKLTGGALKFQAILYTIPLFMAISLIKEIFSGGSR